MILYWYFIIIWYILICHNISIYKIISDIFYKLIYFDISRKHMHYNISIFHEISFYEIYRKLLKFFEIFDILFFNISWYIANLTYQSISNHDISRYIAIYRCKYRYIKIYRINFAILANICYCSEQVPRGSTKKRRNYALALGWHGHHQNFSIFENQLLAVTW